ncbi:hypothetical protein ACHAXS_013634 [Conticribra weissflogii]
MSPRPERPAGKKTEDATDLPPIPEHAEAVLRSQRQYDREDAEDREEQGLFERDNAAASSASADPSGDQWDGIPLTTTAAAAFYRDDGQTDASTARPRSVASRPFYVASSPAGGERWELTWPIWHMLPRDERRAIAAQHGYHAIGDFEEYMSLTRAVGESEGGDANAATEDAAVDSLASTLEGASLLNNDDSIARGREGRLRLDDVDFSDKLAHFQRVDDDDDDQDDDDTLPSPTDQDETSTSTSSSTLQTHLETIQRGGLPCLLPDELLHKTFSYLPVDDHASLALVSPHWSRFTRSEALYKLLCQRIYLRQSKRKTLRVSRFQNSHRRMLELRPRVRTGGGLYVLKHAEVRKIQRDMWTEIPVGAVLESVYYRYLYFFEDGRAMYALTHASPAEMIPRFVRMAVRGRGSEDKWGVWGRYEVQKDEVRVWAAQSWQDVCFRLRVLRSNRMFHYDNGDRGVWTTMVLEDHMASGTGDFREQSADLVRFEIPENRYFRFLRDRRL